MSYENIISFHGHSCPGLAIGYRMTKAALRRLEGKRAEDEEIVAIVENNACGVDALQCVSGCTFGKGNLIFKDYGKPVYTLFNRKTGKGVRVVSHTENAPEHIRNNRSKYISWLLEAPEEELLKLEETDIEEPEYARIFESVQCAFCKERVMIIRTKKIEGKICCIPCAEKSEKRK